MKQKYYQLTLLLLASLISFSSLHAQQFFDDPHGLRTFHESSIGRALMGKHGDLSPRLKSIDEVNDYMNCYLKQGRKERIANARMQEFNKNYRPFLQQAAQHFQIPYTLSSCILFRETFLNNRAVSSANAQTIAQFTPSTYSTLLKHIRETKRLEKHEKAFFEMEEGSNFDVLSSKSKNFFVKCAQITQGEGPWAKIVSSRQLKKDQKLCRKKLKDYHINKKLMGEVQTFIWSISRNMDTETYKRYFKTPKSEGFPKGGDLLPPSSFSSFKKNPMWIMAMNMLYLKRITMDANANFNPEGFNKDSDYLGYLTTVAGAYNRGPGKLNKAVRKANGSTGQWCRELATSRETRNYMLSIKRCMAKGTNYAMTGLREEYECGPNVEDITNIKEPCTKIQTSKEVQDETSEESTTTTN